MNKNLNNNMANIKCVKCGGEHKFSPFNVTIEKKEIIPNLLLIMIIDETRHFIVKSFKSIDTKNYQHITKQMIFENKCDEKCGLYWSDGLDMFSVDALISLLIKNPDKVTNNTIETLVNTIYCPEWWDEFLSSVIMQPTENLTNIIERAIAYKDIAIEIAKKSEKCLKDGKLNLFARSLRIIRERQKRENELILECKLEEEKKKKELEKQENLIKQQEEIKQRELLELEKEPIKILSPKTFEQKFLEDLNTTKKTNTCKFLAVINPEPQVMASVVTKIGEVSKLQTGIESEEKIKKIKLWEYFIQQEKEIKNGIKYKKPIWKKVEEKLASESDVPDIPSLPTDPKKSKTLVVLSNIQKIQYEKIWIDNQKEQSKQQKNSFVLDQWQIDAINHIRSGNSCLITGPTSGGKTYVMMKGLDNIINSDNEHNVVYVSPTFHLAYQTYANVRATFPLRVVAIITAELINIPTNTNIYIGTAPELLNYFVTTKKQFHVGIFDEIHVTSKSYIDTNNKFDLLRAIAYTRLLTKCIKQVIAASATIENEQNMIKFISNRTKIQENEIYLIKYTERVIPLNEYRFVDNTNIIPINRNSSGQEETGAMRSISSYESEHNLQTKAIITSPNLFKLLIQMKKKLMMPSIIFDMSDDIAWKTYVDLINYIETKESVDYSDYGEMIRRINIIINKFNKDRDERLSTLPENDNVNTSKIREENKNNNRLESGLRSISKQRSKAFNDIINDATTVLINTIKKINLQNSDSLCMVDKNINKKIIQSICKFCDVSAIELYKAYPEFKINQVVIDMIEIIEHLQEIKSETPEAICQLNIDKGSYYRFSNSSCGMDQLKAIREPGSNEEFWKQRKTMISLAEAQHINPKDIDGIIDVIMKGLEYGIAIINPSLPFVIQNIILDNLRTKNLGVVIASESMTMGINYPLRSVIIKSNNEDITLNPCKMIQMAGRCGRRGKDTQAHVIYWGITNANESHQSYINPLIYPTDFIIEEIGTSTNENAGSIINNYEKLAVQLGIIYKTLYFEEEKKIKTTITHTNKLKGNLIITNNESNIEEEQLEKQKCEKRKNEVKLLKSQYIGPIIKSLATYIGFNINEANELSDMICKIDNNIILESYSVESFKKSKDINLMNKMIIEMYNKYAASSNTDFLKFLENIHQILQICEYRLTKLADNKN